VLSEHFLSVAERQPFAANHESAIKHQYFKRRAGDKLLSQIQEKP
jgi:hypothetical protein